jgi:hypothetical protein
MEVLNEWWEALDPEKKKVAPLDSFRDLLRSKRIITRDSEVKKLFKRIREVIQDDQVRQS